MFLKKKLNIVRGLDLMIQDYKKFAVIRIIYRKIQLKKFYVIPLPGIFSLVAKPVKFRLARTLQFLHPMLKHFAFPHTKAYYSFPIDNVHYVYNSHSRTTIPILHLPASSEDNDDLVMVYCHGSGSSLNHVYGIGKEIRSLYGISFVGYDYVGDGESEGCFISYEEDIETVLAWVLGQGYKLSKVILCGFSIGVYSALCLEGMMTRIVISGFAGLLPMVEKREAQFEGEILDNVENCKRISSSLILVIHSQAQIIPLFHAEMLVKSLFMHNSQQNIHFHQLVASPHHNTPLYLVSSRSHYVSSFIRLASKHSQKLPTLETIALEKYLLRKSEFLMEKTVVRKVQKKNIC